MNKLADLLQQKRKAKREQEADADVQRNAKQCRSEAPHPSPEGVRLLQSICYFS